MGDTSTWKPNTKYIVKQDWLNTGETQYAFKTTLNPMIAVIIKSNGRHPKNEMISLENYIFNGFDEIKNTKNHLPSWW